MSERERIRHRGDSGIAIGTFRARLERSLVSRLRAGRAESVRLSAHGGDHHPRRRAHRRGRPQHGHVLQPAPGLQARGAERRGRPVRLVRGAGRRHRQRGLRPAIRRCTTGASGRFASSPGRAPPPSTRASGRSSPPGRGRTPTRTCSTSCAAWWPAPTARAASRRCPWRRARPAPGAIWWRQRARWSRSSTASGSPPPALPRSSRSRPSTSAACSRSRPASACTGTSRSCACGGRSSTSRTRAAR